MYPSLPSSSPKYLVSTKLSILVTVFLGSSSFGGGSYSNSFGGGFSFFLSIRIFSAHHVVVDIEIFSLFPASRSKLNSNVEELNLTFNEADILLNFERVLEKARRSDSKICIELRAVIWRNRFNPAKAVGAASQ